MPGDEARLRLGKRMDAAVFMDSSQLELDDLALFPQELEATALFDGAHTPAEIGVAVEDADLAARLCYFLGELGLVCFEEEPVVVAAPPLAPRAAPPAPAARPAPARAKTAQAPLPKVELPRIASAPPPRAPTGPPVLARTAPKAATGPPVLTPTPKKP
jgi:hypothetical protein